MSVKITYFVHGTTIDNETGKATGWLDGELSELGKIQSRELGETVDKKKFEVIYCSDLKRAVDSTQLAFGDGYVKDARIREANYGEFNGQPETFKDDLEKYVDHPFPGGESYAGIEARIVNFLDGLKKDYDGKQVAIVAHQAPQLALEVICNNKTWSEAITQDWRKVGKWQPGWEYEY